MARHFGGLFWRIVLADLFGGFSWLMKQAGFKGRKSKAKQRKKRNV
jgi:hypothetical protein